MIQLLLGIAFLGAVGAGYTALAWSLGRRYGHGALLVAWPVASAALLGFYAVRLFATGRPDFLPASTHLLGSVVIVLAFGVATGSVRSRLRSEGAQGLSVSTVALGAGGFLGVLALAMFAVVVLDFVSRLAAT